MEDAVNLSKNQGSSTIVIVSLDNLEPMIYGANLGDSGYLIYRIQEDGSYKLVFISKVQQHRFNCPFQAGYRNGQPYFLKNKKADDLCHEIKNNDLILLATDGVLDNLYNKDILNLIQAQPIKKLKHAKGIKQLALSIAREASRLSGIKDYLSPFAKGAQETDKVRYKDYMGGKQDDITVVIGRINLRK